MRREKPVPHRSVCTHVPFSSLPQRGAKHSLTHASRVAATTAGDNTRGCCCCCAGALVALSVVKTNAVVAGTTPTVAARSCVASSVSAMAANRPATELSSSPALPRQDTKTREEKSYFSVSRALRASPPTRPCHSPVTEKLVLSPRSSNAQCEDSQQAEPHLSRPSQRGWCEGTSCNGTLEPYWRILTCCLLSKCLMSSLTARHEGIAASVSQATSGFHSTHIARNTQSVAAVPVLGDGEADSRKP